MRISKYLETESANQVNLQIQMTPAEFKKFNLQRFNLEDIIPMAQEYLESEIIIGIVCKHFGVSEFSIKKLRKSGKLLKQGHLVDVRRICYHFMKEYTRMTLQNIGDVFNQGHANVLYHLSCIETWKHTDGELSLALTIIENKIKSKIEKNEQI
jgi:chromosomal replication initiation ATPase DnaA